MPGRWKRGESGNPTGRPVGIVDRRHKLRALIEGHAEELVGIAMDSARAGDTSALVALLSRAVPPSKPASPPIRFDMPAGGDIASCARAVAEAMARGEIDPTAAREVLAALADVGRIVEVEELAERVRALESAQRGDEHDDR